jgi:hypothetical protein
MDENPYRPPQTKPADAPPVQSTVSLLPLLVPVLLVLVAYAVFGMFLTPSPV